MDRSVLLSRSRTFASLLVVFAVLLAASEALAKPRVGVTVFEGAGEGPFRAKVVKALKSNGYQIVGGKQLSATASSAGASLDGDSGFATVAKELGISAFVTGQIGKKKATFAVRNGADGSVISEASFPGANPGKIKAAVAAGFWKKLGGAVAKGSPPSGAKTKTVVAEEAEPADTEESSGGSASGGGDDDSKSSSRSSRSDDSSSSESSSDSESEKPAKPTRARKPEAASEESSSTPGGLKALSVGLGAKAFWRNFDPHQDPDNALSSYKISPGGAAALWLDVFPAAFSMDGFAANIGLTGGFEKGLAISSKSQDGLTKFTTNYTAFDVGLKVRLPLDGAVPFASVVYGKQTYKLVPEGGGNKPVGVLDTDYGYVQATVGAAFLLTPAFNLGVHAGYVQVLSPGSDITSANYFPKAKAMGADVGVSALISITDLIGIRAGLDFRQYGLNFHVNSPDAPAIVGGATDRYLSVFAGVEIGLDGIGAGEAPAPTPAPRKAAAKPAAEEEQSE